MSIAVTSYFDELCTNVTGATSLTFGDVHTDDDGNPIIDPFNTCVLDQGAGQIMVCELATQQNGLIQFSDSKCEVTLIDTTTAADCISTHPGIAFECTGDVECAHRDRCLNEEALAVTANSYNVVATEHLDESCANPTGETVIVAGELFLEGPNDGSCYQLVVGGNHYKRRCLDSGSVILQTFAPNDTTCTDQVWVQETTQYVSNECDDLIESGGFFYSYVSCTATEAAQIVDGTGILSPTPAPVSSILPATDTPAGAAVVTTPEPTPAAAAEEDTTGATAGSDGATGIGSLDGRALLARAAMAGSAAVVVGFTVLAA
eukprot:g10743.t1